MARTIRFGRRFPLPATVQTLHDFLVMERDEKARPKAAPEPRLNATPPGAPLEN